MESLISRISNMGLSRMIEMSRHELISKDDKFQQLENEMSELEYLYSQLELEGEQGKIVMGYVNSLNKIRGAYGDISYAAGIKDAVHLLNSLGLLKS